MTQDRVINPDVIENELLVWADRNPVVFAAGVAVIVFATGFLLFMAVKAVSDAGKIQPPLVVITLVLGIVLLVLTVTVALRPTTTDALAPLIGAGVGGLAGAIAQAFTVRKQDSQYEPSIGEGGM